MDSESEFIFNTELELENPFLKIQNKEIHVIHKTKRITKTFSSLARLAQIYEHPILTLNTTKNKS